MEDEARNIPGLRQRAVDYLYSGQVGPIWNNQNFGMYPNAEIERLESWWRLAK